MADPRLSPPNAHSRARLRRRDATPEAKYLWQILRDWRPIGKARFRRQAVIGPAIADFAEFERRIILVLTDETGTEAAFGGHRAWLEGEGFHVLEIPKADVFTETANILRQIEMLLRDRTPPQTPPHPGEGLKN